MLDPNLVLNDVIQEFSKDLGSISSKLFTRFCDALFFNEIDNDCRKNALNLFQKLSPKFTHLVVTALVGYINTYEFTQEDVLFLPFLLNNPTNYKENDMLLIVNKVSKTFALTCETLDMVGRPYERELKIVIDHFRSHLEESGELETDQEDSESVVTKRVCQRTEIFGLSISQIESLKQVLADQKLIIIFDLDGTLWHARFADGKFQKTTARPGLDRLFTALNTLKQQVPIVTGLWTHATNVGMDLALSTLNLQFDFAISRTDLIQLQDSPTDASPQNSPKNLHDKNVLGFVESKFKIKIDPAENHIIFVDDMTRGIADASHHYHIGSFVDKKAQSDRGLLCFYDDLQRILIAMTSQKDALKDLRRKSQEAQKPWWELLSESTFS